MAERIRIHRENFEARKQQLRHWLFPEVVKQEVIRFLADLGLGKVNRGKKISPERQLHYLNGLRVPLEFFNKPTRRLTLRDIERFETALSSDELRNKCTGRPYAQNTRVEMRKLLKIFLRWRLGAARTVRLTDWLDTHYRSRTPDYLKEAQIEQVYKHCRSARQRFVIAVLFDSGARAEEFHNLRFEDVSLPEGKENFVKITLKQEYSKTLGRTVPLFWKHSGEAVRDYLAERIAAGMKPTDPVFRGDYTATRKMLQRLGQSVLKRTIHYHLFRHSSATYYADKMNRQQLCIRYGWTFSSDMPDVYISRTGVETKALEEKFSQTELSTVKDELARVKQDSRIKDEQTRQMEEKKNERIQQLEQGMERQRRKLEDISRVLGLKPSVEELEAVLKRRTRRSEG
jgi:integrase